MVTNFFTFHVLSRMSGCHVKVTASTPEKCRELFCTRFPGSTVFQWTAEEFARDVACFNRTLYTTLKEKTNETA